MDGKLNKPAPKKVKIECLVGTAEPVMIRDHDICLSGGGRDKSFSSDIEESETTKDDNHLLNIFPNEIWCKVINNVVDTNDQEHLCNSSQFLRRFLLPMRPHFLFEKVAKPLLKYCLDNIEDENSPGEDNADSSEVSDEDDDISESSIPTGSRCISCRRKRKLRWFSDFLKLRLTCKHWSSVIDNIFQNHPRYYKTTIEKPEESYCWRLVELSEDIFDFMTIYREFRFHFEETHGADENTRSPFLGRKLFITVTAVEGVSDMFWEELLNLLGIYGKHIWYLTFQCHDNFRSRVACYSIIRQVLTQFPNLKVLEFQYFTRIVHSNMNEYCAELSAEIRLNPLPVMRTLTNLKINNPPHQIFQEFIRSYGDVGMLDLLQRDFTESYDIYSVEMPNLKQISMHCQNVEFEKLQQVNWQLEKIHLEFSKGVFVKWTKLLDLLRAKWANTLTNLIVLMPEAVSPEDKNTIMENMLDPQEAEFYQNFQRFFRYNIWNIFPKLQELIARSPDGKGVAYRRKKRANISPL